MEFRTIPGFEAYEISREGVVRRRLPGKSTREGRVMARRRPGGYFLIPDEQRAQVWCRTVELIGRAFGQSVVDVLRADDLPGEQWLPAIGFEDRYSVSNMGRVRRMAGGAAIIGRILKPRMTNSGYHIVRLSGKDFSLHRIVARTFFGEAPEDHPEVNHIDGVKTNNRLRNLEWASKSEQQIHAIRIGLR